MLITNSTFVGRSTGRSPGLGALEDFVHVHGHLPEDLGDAAAIEHEASRDHKLPGRVHGEQAVLRGEVDKACAIRDKERVGRRHERIGPLLSDRLEDVLEIVGAPELVRFEPNTQGGRPSLRFLEGRDAPGIVGIVDQRDAREFG